MKVKKVILYQLFLVLTITISAQKNYISNLYVYDLFLMNPANAGMDKSCYSFGLFYQNQWLGIEDSPTTQILSAQGQVKGNLGFGTYIYNDRNGNMKEFGLQQAFSYEVLLKKTKRRIMTLSFGLAFSVEQSSIDAFTNNNGIIDPLVNGEVTSGWGYNTNAGVIFKYNDYNIGLSATNMFNQTNPLYTGVGEPHLPMDLHWFISSLYKVRGREVYLEPIIRVRSNNLSDKRLDISMRSTFPTLSPLYSVWSVLAYRRTIDNKFGTSLGMAAAVGINYQRLGVGLEYQLGLTGAQIEYGSAYQLVVRYSICNNLRHRAIPCSKARQNKKARYPGVIWY